MPAQVAEQISLMTEIPYIWSPRSRLALALSGALVVVIMLEALPALREMIQPLQEFTAALAFVVVKATGLPVAIDNVLLTHPDGFRIAISYGCTPIVPAIFLGSVLTLGLSLSWGKRLIGLISGIVLLTLLNLFRVTALYYIGVVAPGTFAIAHEWLGQSIIVIGTAVVAWYWIDTSVRSQRCLSTP